MRAKDLRRALTAAAHAVLVAVSATVLSCPTALAQQVRPEYELEVNVQSATDRQPLRGATLQIKRTGERDAGKGINDITDSTGDRSREELTGKGVRLNETGSAVIRLAPGEYSIRFSAPTFHEWSQTITVPPPGDEDETRLSFWVALRQDSRLLNRVLWALVVDENGLPISDATVRVFTEYSSQSGSTFTGRMGLGQMDLGSAVIGDTVRVHASAVGYAPQEQTVLVGSLQDRGDQFAEMTRNFPDNDLRRSVIDNLKLIGNHATSKSDFVYFRLKKTDQASLLVQVVKDSDGKPIENADVTFETTTGKFIQYTYTDARGDTKPALLPTQAFGDLHAHYRVRVSAPGYQDRLSDIPDEMLVPGPPQTYLVQLTAGVAEPATGVFSGRWDMIQWGGVLTLVQQGNRVTGTFDKGTVEGTVKGSVLKATWTQKDGQHGDVEWTLADTGRRINGWWNYAGEKRLSPWSGNKLP